MSIFGGKVYFLSCFLCKLVAKTMRSLSSFIWKHLFQILLVANTVTSGGSRISANPGYYLAKFSPKTAWKWKKFNRRAQACPWCPLDPPMIINFVTARVFLLRTRLRNFSSTIKFKRVGLQCIYFYPQLCKINVRSFFINK